MERRELPVAAALGALSLTVVLAFGQVLDGDAWMPALAAAALVPHVVGAALRPLRLDRWVEIAVAAVVLAAGILALTPGGPSPAAVIARVERGWDIISTAPAPVPATPGVVVLAAVAVWTVALLADQLTFRHDASLGALAPGVVVLIWTSALGVRDDAWIPVAAFGAMALLVLALQHQRLLERHRTRIGAVRRLVDAPALVVTGVVVGGLLLAVSIAGAIALPTPTTPVVDDIGVGDGFVGSTTYKAEIDPVIDVGDQLTRPDDVEVFTVEADEPRYWRTATFDVYRGDQGGQWVVHAPDGDVSEGLDEDVPEGALVQRFRIGALGERWMPAAFEPVRVDDPNILVVDSSRTLVTGRDTVSGMEYTVTSDVGPTTLTAEDRRNASGPAPTDLDAYLRLPANLPAIVTETARAVVGDVTDPVEQATLLRDYFRDGSFTYDISPDLGDADEAAIERFLVSRRGFCVQFATAYALMARSLGIPARFAVGYTSGTLEPGTDTHRVSTHDAHAWPELYLAGLGWTTLFEPTPAAADVGGLPGGSALPDEPPPSTQQPEGPTSPPTSVPATAPPTADTAPATGPPVTSPSATTPDPGRGDTGPGDAPGVEISATSDDGGGATWLLLLAVLGMLLLVAPFVAVITWKHRRRSRRRHRPDARDAITGAWHEALDTLTDHRVERSAAETPFGLARRVPATVDDALAPPLHSLAAAYTVACYAPTPPTVADADAAWADVDELRRAVDASATFRARLRARCSLRTLGAVIRGEEPDLVLEPGELERV